ncbi:hypothetical protein [Devosia sp. Leaf64]|uniref:hypothetical protein n=1 Tax=Devosia sp. Leaf64 TaxID=1736229 RepID=UPI000715EFB5|nr:hypothetical protein [Devosia sp. Leaf64]KQN73481.1 hypothetical protein ASE94_06510 [Devosia sp. Leaf64]
MALRQIADISDPDEQASALLYIARFLDPASLRRVLRSDGPIGSAHAARHLKRLMQTKAQDRWISPLIAEIEHRAVQSAGNQVIRDGRIDHESPFAKDLLPALSRLTLVELLKLKLHRLSAGRFKHL